MLLSSDVQAVLRRGAPRVLVHGSLSIDLAGRDVDVCGRRLALSALEFDLLAFLAATPRTALSRADLLRAVWASSPERQDPSTVTEHVRRLRVKLRDAGGDPAVITTLRGVGYRFEPSRA